MSTWKYMQNGQPCGPVETAALTALLNNGTLGPETPVWKEGMSEWMAARTLPEFAGAAPAGGTPPPQAAEGSPDPADVEKNKVFAVLAYIGLLFLVPLLAAPQSPFARYHTNQGVVLFLAAIVGCVAGTILSFIPFLGCLFMPVVMVGILVLMVMGIMNAASGNCKPLPLIGQFKLIK
jgi:uncharacterized membrane protein